MSQIRRWEKGRKKTRVRKLRRILILCEDSKSSRDYLDQFPHNKELVEIDCIGTGWNTDGLMEEAIKRAETARKSGNPFETVWVVFDKDDFPWNHFNRALDLAQAYNEIVPCWSNECFELWYLLHFHYRDTACDRKNLESLISVLMGKKYDKSDTSVYDSLKDKLETAIKNAKKLAYENELANQATRNPSTKVHELVGLLINLDPDKQISDR